MEGKVLVTSNANPDLDGVACAFAYAEFLNKTGRKATWAISGKISQEALFVMSNAGIPRIPDTKEISGFTQVILVDTSTIHYLPGNVDPEKVVEVIDHRHYHEHEMFPRARKHVERVGAAATLIAERFHSGNIKPSKESVLLLYSAIASNTVNFKAKTATEKDDKMFKWLGSQAKLRKRYVHDMFAAKSAFPGRTARQVMEADFFIYESGRKRFGITQLEIIDADLFVSKRIEEIGRALSGLKEENSLEIVFLTCIDVEKGFNLFVASDERSREVLERTLKVTFHGNIARREGVMMRKEIVPLLKKELSS